MINIACRKMDINRHLRLIHFWLMVLYKCIYLLFKPAEPHSPWTACYIVLSVSFWSEDNNVIIFSYNLDTFLDKFIIISCILCVVHTDVAATNSDRKKYTRSENCDEKSRNAVYRKVDDTFDRLEKDGMGSNLAKFRIPRKQNQADSKSNTAAVDPRCERKKYNVATETLLKPDAQKHFNSKANAVSYTHLTLPTILRV